MRDALCFLFHQDKSKYLKRETAKSAHTYIEIIKLKNMKENEVVRRVKKDSIG